MTGGLYTIRENRPLNRDMRLLRLEGDVSGLTNPGQFVLTLKGAEAESGDYVVLLLKVNGKKQGDWVIYQVQDAL